MGYTPKNWTLGDAITEADLEHIEQGIADMAADTGWLTSGITAGPNWTLTNQVYRRVGPFVTVHFRIVYEPSVPIPISMDAVGNITNTVVGNMPEGFIPVKTQVLSAGSYGPLAAGTIRTDGTLALTAVAYMDGGISQYTEYSLGGTYMLG